MYEGFEVNGRTALILFIIVLGFNSIALPLVPFFFGDGYLEGLKQHIIMYAILIVVMAILRFVGLNVLHLDNNGPVPWYASPLVWFSPIFVVAMISMFSI